MPEPPASPPGEPGTTTPGTDEKQHAPGPGAVAACSEPSVAACSEQDDAETCPVCLGFGYVRLALPVGHPQFGQMLPCEACGIILQHRIDVFDRHSSRKGHALEQIFSNFCLDGPASAATEAYNQALAFAREPRGWLVIHGPKGNGKSHLGAAIANHLITACHIPTLFLTAPDFLEALRREIQGSTLGVPRQYSPLLDAARAAPVLILDDLGAERLTEWGGERLYLLLDYRYRLQSPTVLITNEDLQTLPARIYSRLGDRALSTVVCNPGADYRWGDGRVTS